MCSIFGIAHAADGGSAPKVDGGALDARSPTAGDAAVSRDGSADAALPPPTHTVGKACARDADCASGLVCLTVTSNDLGVGGPPGGLCTVDCTAHGQADCDHVDTGSGCGFDRTHTKGVCYELCSAGPVSPGEQKCHDRADFACAPSRTGVGYCTPTCRGDFDCAGRVCEPRSGLCAAATEGTLPLGSPCDPDLSSTDCVGLCSTLGSSTPTKDNSSCTTFCTIGKPGSCGEALNASGPPKAACVLKFASNETEGDLGECAELCDCDKDCTNPGFICSPTAAPKDIGRAGACVPKLTFDGVTPGIACLSGGDMDAAHVHPDTTDAAAPTADAGAPEGPAVAASATGACDCRASRFRPDAQWGAAFGSLLGVAAICCRRTRRSRVRRRAP